MARIMDSEPLVMILFSGEREAAATALIWYG